MKFIVKLIYCQCFRSSLIPYVEIFYFRLEKLKDVSSLVNAFPVMADILMFPAVYVEAYWKVCV